MHLDSVRGVSAVDHGPVMDFAPSCHGEHIYPFGQVFGRVRVCDSGS